MDECEKLQMEIDSLRKEIKNLKIEADRYSTRTRTKRLNEWAKTWGGRKNYQSGGNPCTFINIRTLKHLKRDLEKEKEQLEFNIEDMEKKNKFKPDVPKDEVWKPDKPIVKSLNPRFDENLFKPKPNLWTDSEDFEFRGTSKETRRNPFQLDWSKHHLYKDDLWENPPAKRNPSVPTIRNQEQEKKQEQEGLEPAPSDAEFGGEEGEFVGNKSYVDEHVDVPLFKKRQNPSSEPQQRESESQGKGLVQNVADKIRSFFVVTKKEGGKRRRKKTRRNRK